MSQQGQAAAAAAAPDGSAASWEEKF